MERRSEYRGSCSRPDSPGVSELYKNLDPVVESFNHRPLNNTRFPFVVVNAMVTKVREEGRVRDRGLLLALGVNSESYRELLGLHVGDSESEASWSEFFLNLKQRGLRGLELIVSDQNSGLVKAIRTHYQSVTWQRCQTHFKHNILDKTPKAL